MEIISSVCNTQYAFMAHIHSLSLYKLQNLFQNSVSFQLAGSSRWSASLCFIFFIVLWLCQQFLLAILESL